MTSAIGRPLSSVTWPSIEPVGRLAPPDLEGIGLGAGILSWLSTVVAAAQANTRERANTVNVAYGVVLGSGGLIAVHLQISVRTGQVPRSHQRRRCRLQ